MTYYVDLFERLRAEEEPEVGVTDWFTFDQVKNDLFCHLTHDRQRQYNNPKWAETHIPTGKTVVNPMFTLAVHAAQSLELGIPIRTDDEVTAFNYGYDSIKWNRHVAVDEPVRTRITAVSIQEPRSRHYLVKTRIACEVQGSSDPVMLAESLIYFLPPNEVEVVRAK